MPTRNVVLTDHQDELISQWVSSGRYQNASEVLREGLRLVEKSEAVYLAKLEALRAAVNVGLRAYEEGRFTEVDDEHLDEYFERLDDSISPMLGTRLSSQTMLTRFDSCATVVFQTGE